MRIASVDPSSISHTTLLGKLIRLPFKLLPAGAVVRILRGPASGMRWIADSAANGFWLGYWELEDQRYFASRLRPGDVVYDIGAHVGIYTLLSGSKVGPEGHVYAFEPLPRNARYLGRHIEINGLSNCTVVEAAVSNSAGSRQFDPTEHTTAGHFSDSGAMTVRTLSLDEFVFGSPVRPPNAIKINAEGAEQEVLEGGRRALTEHFPLIFLSTHSEDVDRRSCDLLRSLGYSLRRLAADKIWAEKLK
jgi:FkbM family methyltransferase